MSVYFSRTTRARVLILGMSLHLGMTTHIWVSIFDLDLYFTVHRLRYFYVDPDVTVYFWRTTRARVLILGTSLHLGMTIHMWVSMFDLDLYFTVHRLCYFYVNPDVTVYFSRTTWARVLILGMSLHLGMTTHMWVSIFDLHLYFTVHRLYFYVDPDVTVYFSRTTRARVLILGTSLHLGMTTLMWVSMFDLDLYFTVHQLCYFYVNPDVTVYFSRTTWVRVLILGMHFHLEITTHMWVPIFDLDLCSLELMTFAPACVTPPSAEFLLLYADKDGADQHQPRCCPLYAYYNY